MRYDEISPSIATVGQWYYIVMVRQATTLALYFNGQAVASAQVPSGLIDIGPMPMTIGRESSDSIDILAHVRYTCKGR